MSRSTPALSLASRCVASSGGAPVAAIAPSAGASVYGGKFKITAPGGLFSGSNFGFHFGSSKFGAGSGGAEAISVTGRSDLEGAAVRATDTTTTPAYLDLIMQPAGAGGSFKVASYLSASGDAYPSLTIAAASNTVSAGTGVAITCNAPGSGVSIAATSSGTNETLYLQSKGAGSVSLGAAGATASLMVQSNGATGSFSTDYMSLTAPSLQLVASASTGFVNVSGGFVPKVGFISTGSALSAADSGTIFFIKNYSASGYAYAYDIQIPAAYHTPAGVCYKFVALSGSNGAIHFPAANQGSYYSPGTYVGYVIQPPLSQVSLTGSGNLGFYFIAGDWIEMVCDGSYWRVSGFVSQYSTNDV